MSAILPLVRAGMFFLCMAGWWLWLNQYMNMPVALTPVVSFCSIGCILYLAGLLNVLMPVQIVLYLGGLAILIVALVRRFRTVLTSFLRPSMILFTLCWGWTILRFRGALLQGHDDFAHWGIVAKRLISTGHLANTATTAVEYLDYPPATALWIKFYCNLVGTSDGTMLMAQALLAVACAFAVAALAKNRAQGFIAAGVALVPLSCGLVYGSLMVDGLLTMLGVAAIAAAIAQRRSSRPELAAVVAAPILGFLAITKNSGVFLAILAGLLILAILWKPHTSLRRRAADAVAALAFPTVLWYLWGQHIRLVYPDGMESKHAVDAAAYQANLAAKSPEDLAQFWQSFVAYWQDFSHYENVLYWFVPLAICILAVILWRSGRIRGGQAAIACCAALGGTAIYTVGLAFTYIFSMPVAEMLVLASIGRYSLTFSLLVAGGGGILYLASCPTSQKRAFRWGETAVAVVLCLAFINTWGGFGKFYNRSGYDQSEQIPWLEFKQEYGLPDGAKYVIYTGDTPVDTWADTFVARYVFNTDTLYFWVDKDGPLDLDTICYQYEYLLFWGSDESSRQLLSDWGFDPDTRWIETRLFLARRDEYLKNGTPLPESSLPS